MTQALSDALRAYIAAGFGASTDFHLQRIAYDKAVAALAAPPVQAREQAKAGGECAHGVRHPHECKECADEPSAEDVAAWMRSQRPKPEENSNEDFLQDVYDQCYEAITPLVDRGLLPGSVVESLQILVERFTASAPPVQAREQAKAEAGEHYDEIKATLEGAHAIMESLSAIERRVGPVGSHARGYTHKITKALRHLEALAQPPAEQAKTLSAQHAAIRKVLVHHKLIGAAGDGVIEADLIHALIPPAEQAKPSAGAWNRAAAIEQLAAERIAILNVPEANRSKAEKARLVSLSADMNALAPRVTQGMVDQLREIAEKLSPPLAERQASVPEVSSLQLAVIGHAHFGNPIPKEWYAAAKELLAVSTTPSQGAAPDGDSHE